MLLVYKVYIRSCRIYIINSMGMVSGFRSIRAAPWVVVRPRLGGSL